MSPFIYALNIGTFAAWLTVSGASTVACVIQVKDRLPELVSLGELESFEVSSEVNLGDLAQGSAPPADPEQEITEEENAPQEQIAEAELPEVPEELPEIPDIAEIEPLPEIPDFPEPAPPKPAVPKADSTPKPRASVVRRTTGLSKENTPGARRASSNGQSGAGTGSGTGNNAGSGAGSTGEARFAGGRMGKPRYPSEARRNGQQGKVTVFFTVDERGNVVNASIRSGTPYPLLNEEALRCVRTWKFRAGARASATKPIVFRLN